MPAIAGRLSIILTPNPASHIAHSMERPDRILLATRNRDKLRELSAMLAPLGIPVASLDEAGGAVGEVVEDLPTLEGNAAKKALEVAGATLMWTVADDTGLEVDALGGRPGVLSARYAGPAATYDDNVRKLLGELEGVEPAARGATFRCVIVLARPGVAVATCEGICRGVISEEPRGDAGFGYDPVFLHPPSGLTFAQMDPSAKNFVSHRSAALKELARRLAGPGSPPASRSGANRSGTG